MSLNPVVMRIVQAMASKEKIRVEFEIKIDSNAPLKVLVLPTTAEQIRTIQREGKTLIEIMVHTIAQRSLNPETGKRIFSDYDSDFVLKFPPALIVNWWAEVVRPPKVDRKEWRDEIGKNMSEILFQGCGLTTL